jgi:HEAT repeats
MPSPAPQVVESLLKELIGARKAIRLYPAGNPLVTSWLDRLHQAVQTLLTHGATRVRVTQTGFEWDGGQLATRDRALEALRFELASRQITEIAFVPGIEPWELRSLLERLNAESGPATPQDGGQRPAPPPLPHVTLGDSFARYRDAKSAESSGVGLGLLDIAVDEVLEALAATLRTLTEDRRRLSAWLLELAHPGDQTATLFRGIRMLIPLIETEPDREIRYRTLCDSVMGLSEPLRTALIGTWLLSSVRTDLEVVQLLTRFSADDYVQLAGTIPNHLLETLAADVQSLPIEEWTKARLSETLQDSLAERAVAAEALEPLLDDHDPSLLRLRELAQDGCRPDYVLTHSVAVLIQLFAESESERYPSLITDAVEETIPEALSLQQLGLALQSLRWLVKPDGIRPEWAADHQRRVELMCQRLAGRSHVVALIDLLRRAQGPETVAGVAEYLRTVGRPAIDETITLLGKEAEPAVRERLLEVLLASGPTVAPSARARIRDGQPVIVASVIGLLARLGDKGAVEAIGRVASHPQPLVRREVVQALALLGGERGERILLGMVVDPDAEVRKLALAGVQALVERGQVTAVREFLAGPSPDVGHLLAKRDVIARLASVGRPGGRAILEFLAGQRHWPWRRNERKIRALARDALAGVRLAGDAPA